MTLICDVTDGPSGDKYIVNDELILAVDDNEFTLRIVLHALQEGGFKVATAASGHEALQYINRHGIPHLAIVDLHMPGMSGFEFCHMVRQFSDLPIIMLTAVDNQETIVKGLEQYADDYIVKPFSPQELVARVSRVLRRLSDYNYVLEATTQIDKHLLINFPKREATLQGETVPLTPTETKLLHILVRNAGRIVTTNFLMDRIWPLKEVQEDTLHVHVHRLRQKIEKDPANPHRILSERGIGYTFNQR